MNLRRFLDLNCEVVPERCHGDEVVVVCGCPKDKSGNRSINVKTLKTSCWVCNVGGNALKWLADRGLDTGELDDVPIDTNLDNLFEDDVTTAHTSPFIEVALPDGFRPIADKPDGYYAKAIARMAKRKHLDLDDLIRAKVGYTPGKTRTSRVWEPYAIFPVYEWNRVVYYQGRTYIDIKGESTKRFPSRAECPYSSKYWLYNIDRARKATAKKPIRIILVESILNVLSLEKELKRRGLKRFVPIALFKHALSKEQALKLKRLRHVEEICLMFDSDASDDAWRMTEHLAKFPLVTAVDMPHKVDANDDAERAVDLLLKRRNAKIMVSTLEREVL